MIDVHTHYVPRGMSAPNDGPWVRDSSMIMLGQQEFRRIGPDSWDVEVRLADMDADGVDVQVVSPTPVFFCYDVPVEQAVEVARAANDAALSMCAGAPERLLPMCQVPLQDPDAACAELSRCVDAGHVGVEIGNHVGDRDLDDAGVVTFLQHAASLGAPVFVHPWDLPSSVRLDRWMARWLTGMPAETHLSIVAMILGGVFDRVGPELRICFAHGGGSFPFWLGRLENAWHRRPDLVGVSSIRRRPTWEGSTSTRWCSTSGRCDCWSTRSASSGSWSAATIRIRSASARPGGWCARLPSWTTASANKSWWATRGSISGCDGGRGARAGRGRRVADAAL